MKLSSRTALRRSDDARVLSAARQTSVDRDSDNSAIRYWPLQALSRARQRAASPACQRTRDRTRLFAHYEEKSARRHCTWMRHSLRIVITGWYAKSFCTWPECCVDSISTAKSFFAIVEPGSCFAGNLLELMLASDRSYMLNNPDENDRSSLYSELNAWRAADEQWFDASAVALSQLSRKKSTKFSAHTISFDTEEADEARAWSRSHQTNSTGKMKFAWRSKSEPRCLPMH